jgi:hypothetical protein
VTDTLGKDENHSSLFENIQDVYKSTRVSRNVRISASVFLELVTSTPQRNDTDEWKEPCKKCVVHQRRLCGQRQLTWCNPAGNQCIDKRIVMTRSHYDWPAPWNFLSTNYLNAGVEPV